MKPEEVLRLVGAPDFVDAGSWFYDMDADRPFTLIYTGGVKAWVRSSVTTPLIGVLTDGMKSWRFEP